MLKDRKAYEAKLDRQLTAWGVDLEDLKSRTKEVTVDGMMKFDQALAVLKSRHDQASMHLRHLKASSDEAWEQLKAGTEEAWAEFKALLKHASEHA